LFPYTPLFRSRPAPECTPPAGSAGRPRRRRAARPARRRARGLTPGRPPGRPPPPERLPHAFRHALPLLGREDLLNGAERLGDLAARGLDLRLEPDERAHLLRPAHAIQPLAQRLAPLVQLLLERGRDLLDRRDLLRGQPE